MIIIDWSQTVIASVFAMKLQHDLDEDILRHVILNTIRSYIVKFNEKYDASEVILAIDSANSWRKDVFPQYKANRSKARKDSGIDYSKLFDIMGRIYLELQEHSPFLAVKVDRAEADDIIAVLSRRNSNSHTSLVNIMTDSHTVDPLFPGNKTLIISGDKDFIQLQKYPGIHQFSPKFNKFLNEKVPEEFLLSHIISGDTSDGIANVLSDDDTFVVEKKRQVPMTEKRLNSVLPWARAEMMRKTEDLVESRPEWYNNWIRNRRCIDFDFIPSELEEDIIATYRNEKERQKGINQMSFLDYLISKRCRNLVADIQDFFIGNR